MNVARGERGHKGGASVSGIQCSMVRSDFVHDNNKHSSLVIIINGSYMVIVLGRHCIKMSRQMFRVVQLALERCKAFFDKHYLLANMGVYGSLYSVGDITCQLISHANTTTPHDWERTKRMGTMGCTVLPLLNTYFYRFLDRAFIGGSPRIVFKKLIIDTFVWTPPILAIFIAGLLQLFILYNILYF